MSGIELATGELVGDVARSASVSGSAVMPGYGAWIAIGDQVPEKGQLVLAVDRNGDMAVVQQYNGIFFAVAFGCDAYENNGNWDRSADRIAEKITHWMPLPVAP